MLHYVTADRLLCRLLHTSFFCLCYYLSSYVVYFIMLLPTDSYGPHLLLWPALTLMARTDSYGPHLLLWPAPTLMLLDRL
jgi:hypothetical protein